MRSDLADEVLERLDKEYGTRLLAVGCFMGSEILILALVNDAVEETAFVSSFVGTSYTVKVARLSRMKREKPDVSSVIKLYDPTGVFRRLNE